jgi:hypothetical protein
MMSLEAIKELSDEAAQEAAEEVKVPYIPFNRAEIEGYTRFPFPNLGSYVPEGWELLEDPAPLFCDSSGFGAENESALTPKQLIKALLELYDKDSGYGYAIIEVGQFQVYLGIFRRI